MSADKATASLDIGVTLKRWSEKQKRLLTLSQMVEELGKNKAELREGITSFRNELKETLKRYKNSSHQFNAFLEPLIGDLLVRLPKANAKNSFSQIYEIGIDIRHTLRGFDPTLAAILSAIDSLDKLRDEANEMVKRLDSHFKVASASLDKTSRLQSRTTLNTVKE